MATLTGSNVEEVRRVALSPRPKGRGKAFLVILNVERRASDGRWEWAL